MIHLKQHGDKFKYRTEAKEGIAIEVELDYWKDHQRGIHLAVRPVTIMPDGMMQWVMGAGCNILVLPMERKDKKALAAMAYLVDDIAPSIAREWVGVPNSINGGEAGARAVAAIKAMLVAVVPILQRVVA